MSKISQAREGYKPPTGTVNIVVDAKLAIERKTLMDAHAASLEALSDQITAEAQKVEQRPATPKLKKLRDELEELQLTQQAELVALEEREREHVHKLQMIKLPGVEWNDIADRYPPRLDVQFDLDLGYNHHAVAIAAARHTTASGQPVTVELIDLPEGAAKDPAAEYRTVNGVEYLVGPVDDEDWDTILEVGSGWDLSNIVSLQLNLNVLQASNRLGRLKKD